MEKRPKLAFLAQLTTAVDKFRPETCCVVGNYYAMKSEHEKAVVYFRRALTLDRNCLSAWTLMGHEYVEMKNTHAAIESYRRAIDTNRKDFRAWYGLGQTYEILDMQFYALFYFQRAAALAPNDPKMWNAVGSCLAKINRPSQAIKAYKRALATGSYIEATSSFGSQSQRSQGAARNQVMDPDVLYQIALLYDKIGNLEETEAYLELALLQEEGPAADEDGASFGASMTGSTAGGWASERVQGVGVTASTCKARMWLARIEYMKRTEEGLKKALVLAHELCQDSYEVEEAKSLIRDIRAKLDDIDEVE